jgi:hypothetical protein
VAHRGVDGDPRRDGEDPCHVEVGAGRPADPVDEDEEHRGDEQDAGDQVDRPPRQLRVDRGPEADAEEHDHRHEQRHQDREAAPRAALAGEQDDRARREQESAREPEPVAPIGYERPPHASGR